MSAAQNTFRRLWSWMAIAMCCALLSGFTCFVQVKNKGLSYHETAYLDALRAERITRVPAWGVDIYPLSHAFTLNAADTAARLGIPRGPGLALLVIRLGQNALFFLLFIIYCRAWGVTTYLALLGASALAWALPNTYGAGMLRIPLYTDYVLYLGLAIALRKRHWLAVVILLSLLAANLNSVVHAIRMITLGVSALPEHGSWPAIAGTLGILPLLAAATVMRWPRALQIAGLVLLVPVLFSRGAPALTLIPWLALVVVPAVLLVLQGELLHRTPRKVSSGDTA